MALALNDQERRTLAPLVMGILDEWRIDGETQTALLGMGDVRPRHLNRYRQGTTPLPAEPELIERARHIVGIQSALHMVFPMNPNMPTFWLSNPNNRHFGRSPLSVMLEEGLNGMSRVWGHLDSTQNWV